MWNNVLGPEFSPEETYKLIEKKYGKKAAAKYKPGSKGLSSRLSAVVVDGGKPDDKLKDAGKMVGIVNFMQNGKKNGSKDMV